MLTLETILVRVLLAFVLSGAVGLERETRNHTAGFRTHILVCVGSTLVMLVSLYMFELYKGQVSLDPARLGAQVISGIGFLGAGTILKEGASIRGLTTAAGLWAVACIGLAVGVGFYEGAVAVTVTVVLTLTIMDKLEERLIKRKNHYFITLRAIDRPGQLGKIGCTLGDEGISIKHIKMLKVSENVIEINLTLKLPERMGREDVCRILSSIDGIEQIVDVS